jgi:hypothetical protein
MNISFAQFKYPQALEEARNLEHVFWVPTGLQHCHSFIYYVGTYPLFITGPGEM